MYQIQILRIAHFIKTEERKKVLIIQALYLRHQLKIRVLVFR